MIAVIADDLTGAAELAGIGLRYQLRPQIVTDISAAGDADLLVISMDSRSMSKEDAIRKATDTTIKLAALNPEFIYKKVDSALRGYIVDEIAAHLKILHLKKALLIPANPALGRKIVDGIYLLNDQPIHLSAFSKDPEFPITSSGVSRMLSSGTLKVAVLKPGEQEPDTGIVAGEVSNAEDLEYWAGKHYKDVFLSGASGFFTTLLNRLGLPRKEDNNKTTSVAGIPSLYICGSAFTKSIEAIREIKINGGPVSYMPAGLIGSGRYEEEILKTWSDEIVALLNQHDKAIIAIDSSFAINMKATARQLREITAACVHAVYNKVSLGEMIIEGGSTASAVVSALGFRRFSAVQEIVPGVVRMQVQNGRFLYLTIKPGSYAWSKDIWTF